MNRQELEKTISKIAPQPSAKYLKLHLTTFKVSDVDLKLFSKFIEIRGD